MTLATVDQYGAPSYGPIGRPPAGMCFHSPENVDHTLAQAIAVARWQGTSANTSGGSYHGILGYDASRGTMDDPEAWVMVRSVPWDQASGGISTVRTNPPWNPDRYPWIRQLLPPAAFADPNRWLHQIALSGKANWYAANGYPKGAVIRTAEWVKTLENVYQHNGTGDAILTLHRHWQTDRTDPGPENFINLVLEAYAQLDQPTPEPVPELPPPAEDPRVAALEAKLAEKNAALDRILTLRLPALRAAHSALGDAIGVVEQSTKFTRDL